MPGNSPVLWLVIWTTGAPSLGVRNDRTMRSETEHLTHCSNTRIKLETGHSLIGKVTFHTTLMKQNRVHCVPTGSTRTPVISGGFQAELRNVSRVISCEPILSVMPVFSAKHPPPRPNPTRSNGSELFISDGKHPVFH